MTDSVKSDKSGYRRKTDGSGIDVGGWKIRVRKHGIVSSSEEAQFQSALNIKLPGMLFGRNRLLCTHIQSGVTIKFDTRGALGGVGPADPHLVVRSAKHWQQKKQRSDIQVLDGASDWTFSTRYKGDVEGEVKVFEGGRREINYGKLKRMDIPILFYDEVLLFEDELDDNGQSSFTIRIRTMPDFFFILARFFLRIDGVLLRVYDTRYYHEYNTNYIIRECQHREDEYDNIVRGVSDVSFLKNSDLVAQRLRVVSKEVDEVQISNGS